MRKSIRIIVITILSVMLLLVLSAYACATPLIEAAKEGDAERVAELIESGEDMDLPDRDGIPAIMWAIMKGHVDVAVLLLENGAALKTGSNYDEVRIILGLVKDPRRAADLLVKRRPYVLAGENYGSILLINALRYSRKDVARALMEKGLNFKVPDDNGVTPLAYAITFGHKKLGGRLYDSGAYFYEPGMGEKETMLLADDKGHDEIVDFIVRRAVEKAPGEKISLAEALKNNLLIAVAKLIEDGINVNEADSSGDTPLYIAAGKGNPEAVKLLLDAGADPNAGCRGD